MRNTILLASAIIVLAGLVAAPAAVFSAEKGPGAVIKWEKDFDAAVKKAKEYYKENDCEEAQLIIMVFYEPDDANSKQLLNKTLKDQNLVAMSRDYLFVKIDTTKDKKLFRKHNLQFVPALAFFNHDGERMFASQGGGIGPNGIKRRINHIDNINQDYYELKTEMKESPDDMGLVVDMGNIWLKLIRSDMAKPFFEKAAAAAGDDVAVKTRATYGIGRCFSIKKKLIKAAEYYKKARDLDPENKSGIMDLIEFELANIIFRSELWTKALKALKAFLEKYPKSSRAAKAAFNIGNCHFKRNETAKAIEAWKKTAKEYPNTKYGKLALRNWKSQKK